MKVKRVKLLSKPNHISKFLIHWTGRGKDDRAAFETLCKIIKCCELKFGSNMTSFPNAQSTVHNTMICFTDTPIEHALEHCQRYNFFGISFKKHAMIEYGANPVLYLVDNRKIHHDAMSSFTFQNYNYLLTWFGAVLQPYNITDQENGSYFKEREWRIIRKLRSSPVPPFQSVKENTYPFFGTIREEAKINTSAGKDYYLKFDSSIIENIIVPTHYFKKAKEFLKTINFDCKLVVIKSKDFYKY